MRDFMESLPLALFKFYFNPLEEIKLPPYKGSAFRGGFGLVFKKVICINNENDCKNCLLKFKCIYSYIFETPIGDKRKFESTYLPHPYILEPPLDNKDVYPPGNVFVLNLILIGKSIEYLPYFIFVMEEFGKKGVGKNRGRFILEKVENLSRPFDEKGMIIFDNKTRRISSDIIIKTFSDISKEVNGNILNVITLNFLTPCRIIYKNRLMTPSGFNFFILMKNLLRRLYLLSTLTDSPFKIDYKALLSNSKSIAIKENKLYWYDWERYSSRQNQRMRLGGFKGEITFHGEMKSFLPFLKIGEYIHLGKDTSFGLGKYLIVGGP